MSVRLTATTNSGFSDVSLSMNWRRCAQPFAGVYSVRLSDYDADLSVRHARHLRRGETKPKFVDQYRHTSQTACREADSWVRPAGSGTAAKPVGQVRSRSQVTSPKPERCPHHELHTGGGGGGGGGRVDAAPAGRPGTLMHIHKHALSGNVSAGAPARHSSQRSFRCRF